MGTTKSTTTTTRRTKVTRPTAATASSGAGAATTSLPDDATKEGVDCKFDGLVEDKGNCQSKRGGAVLSRA